MSIFDAKPKAAPVDRGPSGKEAERILAGELLAAFRHQAQTTTEFMERFAGQAVNSVLEVYSGVFDATGQWTRDYGVAAGSIDVSNLGVAGHIITVSAASNGGGVSSGTGTYLVDGGTHRVVSLASRAVTLYGTAGDRFAVQVFSAGVRPVTA